MLEFHENGYSNGYIERKAGGHYEGTIEIEGVDLSPIDGVYFKEDGSTYLWLKRRSLLEYDDERKKFVKRSRNPRWEVYMKKQKGANSTAFRGEFFFLHFKYSIIGMWDKVMAKDKHRLNLIVERLPMNEQTLINNIKESKINGCK